MSVRNGFLYSFSTLSNGSGDDIHEELRRMTDKHSHVVKENSALTLALCACQV